MAVMSEPVTPEMPPIAESATGATATEVPTMEAATRTRAPETTTSMEAPATASEAACRSTTTLHATITGFY